MESEGPFSWNADNPRIPAPGNQDTNSRPSVAGMPRRFGIGTGIKIMVFFSVLASVLEVLKVPPLGFAIISLFFGFVGASQAVLFKGKHPRLASMAAGFLFFILAGLGADLYLRIVHEDTFIPD